MTDRECPYCKSTDINCFHKYRKQAITISLYHCESCGGEFDCVYAGDPTTGNLVDVVEEFNPQTA